MYIKQNNSHSGARWLLKFKKTTNTQKLAASCFSLILASCNQHTDNDRADRFPGFSQIGTDKDTAQLFVDFTTVKRNDSGNVTFKLLRVLDSGYAIQDALTDCRSLTGLPGTRFTNKGIGVSDYPADASAIVYPSNPAWNTLIGKVCEKADESKTIAGTFDDIKALEMVYGNYRSNAKAAYWATISPPDTADFSTFKDQDGIVKIVVSQDYQEGGHTRHILLTQTQLAEGGNNCHACAPLLGAIIFVQDGNKWRLESENRFLTVMGAYGEPPELGWANIGKDTHAITIKMADIHQGVVSAFIGIYKLGGDNWHPLLEWLEESETITDFHLTLSKPASAQDYAQALIRVESQTEQTKSVAEKVFAFDGLIYKPVAKSASAASFSPMETARRLVAQMIDSIKSHTHRA